MDSPGDNCSEFCYLKSGSLVYNVPVFSVPAVAHFSCYLISHCDEQSNFKKNMRLKIKLLAFITLGWIVVYMKKKLSKRRTRASFSHTALLLLLILEN